jgi:two-component system OmpR family response regulator
MRILLVEDAPGAYRGLAHRLQEADFTVVGGCAAGSHDWASEQSRVDAIVLDVAGPSPHGYGVLRALRTPDVWLPLLMVAPGGYDEADAFVHGADDYLTKPYRFRTLAARLRALARRGASRRPAVLSMGTLSLDPVSRIVSRNGRNIELTRREFSVLEHLMRRNGGAATRAEILESVWDQPFRGARNIVDVYVRNLRRKIDVPFGMETIESARAGGYRLLS